MSNQNPTLTRREPSVNPSGLTRPAAPTKPGQDQASMEVGSVDFELDSLRFDRLGLIEGGLPVFGDQMGERQQSAGFGAWLEPMATRCV